ncbi:hypothetical protein HOG21_07470 [bacterium]|nr:hypothetical protein [bacterium]
MYSCNLLTNFFVIKLAFHTLLFIEVSSVFIFSTCISNSFILAFASTFVSILFLFFNFSFAFSVSLNSFQFIFHFQLLSISISNFLHSTFIFHFLIHVIALGAKCRNQPSIDNTKNSEINSFFKSGSAFNTFL